jgi:glycosyltransferase involved in cell wall biosynthesis
MKSLFVNDEYSRASAAGAAVAMAEAVAREGVEVHFLATVQEEGKARSFEANGVKVRLEHVPPYNLRWRAFKILNNKAAVRVFRRVQDEVKPDVVHFHNVHIHFSFACLREAKAPTVLAVHDVMPFCNHKMYCFLDEDLRPEVPVDYRARFFECLKCQRLRFNPFRNRVIREILTQHVDAVVPVSGPMGHALEQNGIPYHAVIHNGIDCDDWKPWDQGGRAFRHQQGLEGAKLILHGGRLSYHKGSLHLVRCLPAVLKEVPRTRLLVLGRDGPGLDAVRAEAERVGVKECLALPGWLDRDALRGAYAAADLVASPSLCFESFNLMNLEGMAMAKPVITSFFGGPSELVLDGVTGYLVNPLDERALSEKIISVLGDDDRARRMGRAGRERAEQGFQIKMAGRKIKGLYEDRLKGIIKV